MPEFKHLGKSGFPHADNMNVYKYDNQFDYSRYDYNQMRITICSVPWDLGEAHIGNRSIDGVGNVVYFGSKQARDNWFDSIPDKDCFRWETKYKELHRDNYITVPLPFDVAARYNYMFVQYHLFANDNNLIQYEDTNGIISWCYFVRNVEFLSPNTSRLELMDDTWQTFIYDVDVTGMILERGHAPMYAIDADTYLANPQAHTKYLLAKDVNFGELHKVTHTKAVSLNNTNIYACVVTSGHVSEDWGTKDKDSWHTPTPAYANVTGVPNFCVMAMPAASLNTLLETAKATCPQFMQTVQAVFFMEAAYLNLGSSFAFCGVTCNRVISTNTQTKNVINLAKSQFGYESKYVNIAKLYTWPYAALEITDEAGNATQVRIEETTGTIMATVAAQTVFPYVNLEAILSGVGGAGSVSVSFANINARSFDFSGRWYQHLMRWEVPTFAVLLQASSHYDYATHFDRLQMGNDRETNRNIGTHNAKTTQANDNASATTELANTNASATMTQTNVVASANTTLANARAGAGSTKANSDESANTARTNATNIANASYTATTQQSEGTHNATLTQNVASQTVQNNSAQNIIDNGNAQTTANTTINTKANQASTSDCNLSNSLSQALQAWDAGYSRATVCADTDAAWYSAGVAATSSVVGGAANGAITGFGTAGPPGATIGAIGGLVSGGIGAATTGLSTAITTNLESRKTEASISNSQNKTSATNNNNSERTSTANNGRTGQCEATNTMIATSVANTAATLRSNASTTKKAADSAADSIQNATNSAASTMRDAQITAAKAIYDTTTANNVRTYDTATANAVNSNETARNNAQRSYDTATANAQRAYDTEATNITRIYDTNIANVTDTYDNSGRRIQNLVRQAALDAPLIYGHIDNAKTATTLPQAIFANVITEPDYAIANAGDEFLRYGYYLNQCWDFDGNWCIGKHFTYWKLKDYWVKTNAMQDQYQDAIRFFLMGGVTVWSKPEEIGAVSIYDN